MIQNPIAKINQGVTTGEVGKISWHKIKEADHRNNMRKLAASRKAAKAKAAAEAVRAAEAGPKRHAKAVNRTAKSICPR